MWPFGKKKKKQEAETKRQEELARQAKIEEEKKKAEQEELKKKAELKKKTEKLATKKVAPKKTAPKPVNKVAAKPVAKKPAPKPAAKKGPSGKYEVYPEAGLFKYRLKASNGEILVVSFGYSTKKGAKNGIETFRKAVLTGNFELSTDKVEFSHFDLFGARGARVIAIGEFYKTLKLAESAVESVKKFYETDKVLELTEISSKEVREEIVENQNVDENTKGKFKLEKEDAKSFFVKLVASNGQQLLVSQKYASKQSALNGLEAIKKAIHNQNFTVSRDKQNRYQFNLYTSNKQLIISGETYPVKANCLSSIQSVIRFGGKAELVE